MVLRKNVHVYNCLLSVLVESTPKTDMYGKEHVYKELSERLLFGKSTEDNHMIKAIRDNKDGILYFIVDTLHSLNKNTIKITNTFFKNVWESITFY